MLAVVLSFLIAWRQDNHPQKSLRVPESQQLQKRLLCIHGRSESLVGSLFEKMEQELQLDIEVQYGSTSEMATRFLTEGAQSPVRYHFRARFWTLGCFQQAKVHWRHWSKILCQC